MTTSAEETVTAAGRQPAGSARRVDVVIPCYNYGRYLDDCVGSVLRQGVDVRVLVIDDASTDDTPDVGRRLAAEHPQVEYRRHDVNRGHIATYNEGLLEWASSEYVLLLSADDLLTPRSLDRSVDALERYPSAGLAYGHPLRFEGDQPGEIPRLRDRVVFWSGPSWVDRRLRECVNVVETPTAVVRTSVQRRAGGYDQQLPHAGDVDMWLRIASISDVLYLSSAQACYRVHGASMSQKVYRTRLADVQERLTVFAAADGRRRGGATAPVSARPDDRVARVLASEQLWSLCRRYEKDTVSADDVDDTLAFAKSIYPRLRALPAYRALRRRQLVGPGICRATQMFIGTAVVRRVRNDLWWRRWKRQGG